MSLGGSIQGYAVPRGSGRAPTCSLAGDPGLPRPRPVQGPERQPQGLPYPPPKVLQGPSIEVIGVFLVYIKKYCLTERLHLASHCLGLAPGATVVERLNSGGAGATGAVVAGQLPPAQLKARSTASRAEGFFV